jgi:hypothetical protein
MAHELPLSLAEVADMPDFRDVVLNEDKIGYFVYIPDSKQWVFALYGHPAFMGVPLMEALIELAETLPDNPQLFPKIH